MGPPCLFPHGQALQLVVFRVEPLSILLTPVLFFNIRMKCDKTKQM